MTDMEKHRIFDTQLEKLTHRVVKMSHLVKDQIENTILAMENCDLELANQVIENDRLVDKLDVKIDKLCLKIFALQQPVASDLRFIMSSLKINNDLERIGDHAVNIAKRIHSMSGHPHLLKDYGVTDVADQVNILFKIVDKLVETRNPILSNDIFHDAKIIKERCQLISERMIQEMMHQKEVIVVATNIMIIANLFERIAAYSTNIAEAMVFVAEGKIIKHKNRADTTL